jgi:site-specific DNA-methyltransferase (adenine-specific)
MWNGMMQGESILNGTKMQGNKALNEKRIHPTQKPVALYKWLLDKYAESGDKILDTHFGSGSLAIACEDYGFDLTACEIDANILNDAMIRYDNHVKQQKIIFK